MKDRTTSVQLPPMAELHCHQEGTVTPELARKLGARHGIDLSEAIGLDGRYRWTTFIEFLNAYDLMTEAIRTPEDYYDITYGYYADMASRGLIYGEMFVSPLHGLQAGMSYPTLITAISDAMKQAEADHGVVARIILIAVRHFGTEHVQDMARLALAHPHPYVTGFGMGGDEAYGRPADYARAFAIAADAGLRLTAHAGEVMGADSVRETLEALSVERIGHGVRAIEDETVLAMLADKGTVLEVCPGSNIALGVFPDHESHPLRRLMERGLKVTLNSDDPPFFFTDIEAEYKNAALYHGCTVTELAGFTKTAIEAAFCDDKTKERLLARCLRYESAMHMMRI